MSTTPLDAQAVGARAAQILQAIEKHPLHTRLTESSLKYTSCWFTTTGYATISNWDLESDAPPLAVEGLRVLAIKAAVYEMTGDEVRAELLVPAPVDEMIHAILAQWNVMTAIQQDLGIRFVHATELEEFTYSRGCETDAYYAAAGWGPQPTRYWLTSDEVSRRLAILVKLYDSIGIDGFGRRHEHSFDEATVPA
ncbi:hypothetical protein ACIBSW_39560 [Actinoplanes sp. NPDC049668]|uniref:hypothetical protein n=1 Tax=unclassified Actinoplanes TaxID=2626549 RepID=UPI0033A8F67C